MQISIFDGSIDFKINKPIRLIELFGGYGSQHFALEYLGANFEQWKLCEWAVKSIQAYKDAHCKNDNTDYSKEKSQQQIIDFLANKGISSNYNEPMTYEQVKRLGEQKQRQIYNNIIATHNLVNIQQVKANDLQIVNTDKYCYVMTYSFPCQDLSKAGLGKGMEKGSGTRSGLLWEVERLLNECHELPQILLMENVPQVHGKKNIDNFNEWCAFLESKGYKNYWQDLNAKNYGIPQNRNRTFMVSLLGDYKYDFPTPFELKLRLKDMLEENVDEKFYLSEKALNGKINSNFGSNNINSIMEKDGIIPTLMARDYKDPKLVKVAQLDGFESSGRIYSEDGLAPTINTMGVGQREPKIAIKNSNIKNVMTDLATTLGTNSGGGVVLEKEYKIRKLTPKECFRLMGVKDKDFENIAQNQSNASLYHLAGDSIVVDVLMYIFKNML